MNPLWLQIHLFYENIFERIAAGITEEAGERERPGYSENSTWRPAISLFTGLGETMLFPVSGR